MRLKSLDRLRGHPLLSLITSERGPFRALKMRRVPQEPVFDTARIFRTVEACFWYRVLHRGKLPPQRSLAYILVDLVYRQQHRHH